MARPVAHPERALFQGGNYRTHEATQNAYYAGKYGYSWTFGTGKTQSAERSGKAHKGHYTGSPDMSERYDPHKQQSVINPRGMPFDQYGNPTRQQGDTVLGQMLMGGYQFPGQAFAPRRTEKGQFIANRLSMFLQSLGTGGYSHNMLQRRRKGEGAQSTGWKLTLSQSMGANKEPDGKGKSSIYQGKERYSTQETRMGTNYGTDPNAGFKALQQHGSDQHYLPELANMYKEQNTDTGPARRFERKFL